MSELTSHAIVIVQNPQGLHMRPADMLVKVAGRYSSNISIERAGQRVDCKSILGILTLGATQGAELLIQADGPDAAEAVSEIVGLFDRSFDET
jgi:phosphocarrier protein HPr